jgi:hypothetical protein
VRRACTRSTGKSATFWTLQRRARNYCTYSGIGLILMGEETRSRVMCVDLGGISILDVTYFILFTGN